MNWTAKIVCLNSLVILGLLSNYFVEHSGEAIREYHHSHARFICTETCFASGSCSQEAIDHKRYNFACLKCANSCMLRAPFQSIKAVTKAKHLCDEELLKCSSCEQFIGKEKQQCGMLCHSKYIECNNKISMLVE